MRRIRRKRQMLAAGILTLSCTFPSQAGQWHMDERGWKWQSDQGVSPAGGWQWIDGNGDGVYENYYFQENGYLLVSGVTPDGWQVDANGAQLVNGAVRSLHLGIDSLDWEIVATDIPIAGEVLSLTEDIEGTDSVMTDEVLEEAALLIAQLVNEEREARGKSALILEEELSENAAVRAGELVQTFAHTRPNGESFRTAITAQCRGAGENAAKVAIGSAEQIAQRVVNGWIASAIHHSAMLQSKWKRTGVGLWAEDGQVYAVQLMVR